MIAADADAREIPPRGQLTPQRNAALGVEGEQIGHQIVGVWRNSGFLKRVAVARIALVVVHEAAVHRADEQNVSVA